MRDDNKITNKQDLIDLVGVDNYISVAMYVGLMRRLGVKRLRIYKV